MKITINDEVLKKYNLTWNEFQILLTGYFGIDYYKEYDSLVKKGIVEKNLFNNSPPILSGNTKKLIAKILIESDDRLIGCGIDDYEGLAQELIDLYPTGNKPGTTYPFGGTVDEIAYKLRTIVVKYNFPFTESEAIHAVKEYVNGFKCINDMILLRNFILYTTKNGDNYEMKSLFMTYIENYRERQ